MQRLQLELFQVVSVARYKSHECATPAQTTSVRANDLMAWKPAKRIGIEM